MNSLCFDPTDPKLAAAAWSRIAEPGDELAGTLIAHLGASDALVWLVETASTTPHSTATPSGYSRRVLQAGVERWGPRLDGLNPEDDLTQMERLGGTVLLPTDSRWPSGLRDLGAQMPHLLWVRGNSALAQACARSIALVGARASTAYGEQVTRDLASGLTSRGFTVVSGGAYGIDAAAHRGALGADGNTIAVMAGGVDRLYPQGNYSLLEAIAESGTIISEVPPGATPFRQRFLARNRLIAAMTKATVVVEAAVRSGALSTARRAVELLRPLGAVPGPVTSMSSAGCHQLVRDGLAVLITDAAEAAELAGGCNDVGPERQNPDRPDDRLSADERAVRDALPANKGTNPARLSRVAGLPITAVLGALGVLETQGLAELTTSGWRAKIATRPSRA